MDFINNLKSMILWRGKIVLLKSKNFTDFLPFRLDSDPKLVITASDLTFHVDKYPDRTKGIESEWIRICNTAHEDA